jgi:hypothetical protein
MLFLVHSVHCLLTSLSLCPVCMCCSLFFFSSIFFLDVVSWCCFLSLSTCNFQDQEVSLLRSFVETVSHLFFPSPLTVFKPFQNKFSLHYHDIHHIMIGTFFLLFLFIFSYIFIAVILILEHATFLLSSGTSQMKALHQAQLQYIQS